MTEERSPTPERELLKFIEEKKPSSFVKARKTAQRSKSFVSVGGLRGRASFFKASLSTVSFGKVRVNLKLINATLFLALLSLIGFLSYDFIAVWPNIAIEVDKAVAVSGEESSIQHDNELVAMEERSLYLEKARKRDIFQMVTIMTPIVETATEQVVIAPKAILVKTKDLRLVGIAWSKDPDAMIENAASQRTFFLKRGDTINDVKVQAIFKDKVVLHYEGEEIELK